MFLILVYVTGMINVSAMIFSIANKVYIIVNINFYNANIAYYGLKARKRSTSIATAIASTIVILLNNNIIHVVRA